MQIEQLTQEEYSFYLAHGAIDDESLQLNERTMQIMHADVEM